MQDALLVEDLPYHVSVPDFTGSNRPEGRRFGVGANPWMTPRCQIFAGKTWVSQILFGETRIRGIESPRFPTFL
jgi:hypothetical protein